MGSRRGKLNTNRQVVMKMNHINEHREKLTDMPNLCSVGEGRRGRALIASALPSVGGVCVGDMSRSGIRVSWETCLIGRKVNRGYKS